MGCFFINSRKTRVSLSQHSCIAVPCVRRTLDECLVAELLQTLVLSVLAGKRVKRTGWRKSILAVSYSWRKRGSWEVGVKLPPPAAAVLRALSKLRVCLPAILLALSFLRSSAYSVESSGVVGLCQYRQILYHHMQFLFHVEMAILM